MSDFAFMLCADDYALAPGVSIGILEALSAGRLTATSVMTNRPLWRSAAADLARFAPHAQIGLHLNLTLGAPCTSMPEFAPHGRLPALSRVIRATQRRALPQHEIRAEIAGQLDAFADAMGRPPDYVDGHQHVHVLPGVRTWLLDELAARALAGRIWLRDSSDRPSRIVARRSETLKALALAWFGHGFARLAQSRGFICNDGFAGFSRFDPRADYGADFARYLVAPGPRHLVMCHPGHVDPDLAAIDPVTTTRERELEFLLSDRFEAILQAAGARLGRWTGLTNS